MATFDRDAGLAEYHQALAKVKAKARAVTRSPTSHRVRGPAFMVLALMLLLGATIVFYSDWYAPTHGKPATATITELHRRAMDVAFTTSDGVPQTGTTTAVPGARVGEQVEILYMEGSPSPDEVQVWNAATPPAMTKALILTVMGLIVLGVGLLVFSGRAPWRDAVWLDERSVTARSGRP